MSRIEEINKRLAEIRSELDDENADVEALSTEVENLETEKKSLMASAEKRKATLERIAKGESKVVEEGKEEEETMEEKNVFETAEYRSAFFKKLQKKELNEMEMRAYAQAGTNGVLPVSTADEIIKKLTQYAKMLNEITLLHVPGLVKFAVEGTKTSGALHTENEAITGDSDTLVTVTLAGYEITKLIQVSASVEKMSIDAFEAWLVDMIVEMIGDKIEDLIFNGTGSNQPKGIDAITWTNGTNAINIAKNAAITADNVRALIALLPGGYDNGAKFFMRKATLFNRIMGLQDNAKHDLVREVNGEFYIYGYPVRLSDKAPADEIILGNAKKYVANLAENITVKTDFDIDTNSNKYLGCAIFDGKPGIEAAFVKIVQLTA